MCSALEAALGADIRGPRTLVLCFDGTGNQFGDHNTNVAHFFKLLKDDDENQQKVYYQPGIGTAANPQLHTAWGQASSKALDMAFAWSIGSHIMDGYKFLVDNYAAGDKICLFGFSRGAFTARAVAGMLHAVGLLRTGNEQDISGAYKLYMRTDELACEVNTEFKKKHSINVFIEVLGVWDTVCSVGMSETHFPFTAWCPAVRTFRHALSLDERRIKFQAEHHDGLYKTDVKEMWFAGCHADVGGGSVLNETRYSLPRIPLRWMVLECFRMNTGIRFRSKLLEDIGFNPNTLYPDAKGIVSASGLVPVPQIISLEEAKDALCPMYDQLVLMPSWWFVEVAFIPWQKQQSNRKRKKSTQLRISWFREFKPPIKQRKVPTCQCPRLRLRLARGRTIPADTAKFIVHESVRLRMTRLGYKPAAGNWDLMARMRIWAC